MDRPSVKCTCVNATVTSKKRKSRQHFLANENEAEAIENAVEKVFEDLSNVDGIRDQYYKPNLAVIQLP